MDKMSLREDAAMQEHYFFAKISNMWKHYKGKQAALLAPDEYQKRLEDGFYPDEVPDVSWKRFLKLISLLSFVGNPKNDWNLTTSK